MTPFRVGLVFVLAALTAMAPLLGQGVSQLDGSTALASISADPALVVDAHHNNNNNGHRGS